MKSNQQIQRDSNQTTRAFLHITDIEIYTVPRCTQRHKRQKTVKAILNKNNTMGSIRIPDFKL